MYYKNVVWFFNVIKVSFKFNIKFMVVVFIHLWILRTYPTEFKQIFAYHG